MNRSKKLFLTAVFLLIFGMSRAGNAGSNNRYPGIPANMWKGIMAEAVSEGRDGMYAVACCYRNRIAAGIQLGCVGLKRKDLDAFCEREGYKQSAIARDIIFRVFQKREPDVTGGATHYENIERYGVPYWAAGMQKTVKIGEHTFYKARR